MIAIPWTFAINNNNHHNKSIYFLKLTSIVELKHVQMQSHTEGPS